ncbi:hypothetical protein [Ralstonia phage phiRSL1]|uniref:Uncharacterized protein n=1 Tax=Ralstonia phage phiRSL1 TaxID=1980924 RepID=B2ZYD0_9CAUD|nr:hypothetical protein RSL1_ORF226 [Ralstonia phage phiRSL1]BAG41676.1 hypothetical protein [Ralstonia phage phiRSL1]
MPLTIHQIVKKTNRLRVEGSRYVRFIDLKKGFDSLGRGFIAGASYSTHIVGQDGRPHVNPNPHKYVTVITFLDQQLHVHVSCSCADMLYRWEVALTSKGAAEIEYSNGDLPTTTNPQLKVMCCKHVLALYTKIKPKLPAPKKK